MILFFTYIKNFWNEKVYFNASFFSFMLLLLGDCFCVCYNNGFVWCVVYLLYSSVSYYCFCTLYLPVACVFCLCVVCYRVNIISGILFCIFSVRIDVSSWTHSVVMNLQLYLLNTVIMLCISMVLYGCCLYYYNCWNI